MRGIGGRKPLRARKRRGTEDRNAIHTSTRYLIRHSKHDIFSRAGIHTTGPQIQTVCLSVYSGASLFASRASAAELKGATREENKKRREREREKEKRKKMMEQERREGLSGSIGLRAIITAFNPVPLPSLWIQSAATIDKYVSNNSSRLAHAFLRAKVSDGEAQSMEEEVYTCIYYVYICIYT